MNRAEMQSLIAENSARHYVYLLCEPDGTPFYVGLGQGSRLFAHEEEATDASNTSAKCAKIRELLSAGKEIRYEIDSWHDSTPWDREAELIAQLDSTVQLTNAQRYAPSAERGGAVLRKYADAYPDGEDVRAIPADFPYSGTKLTVGPRRPGPRAKVYGRIYAVLEANPGITGAQLIERLHEVDWSDVKSIYAEGRSVVSGKWLADYIKGGFYTKNQFIAVDKD